MAKVEDLLHELGQPGRQQIIATIFLILSTTLSIASNHMMSLITLTPAHHCKIINDEFQLHKNESIPMAGSFEKFDSCNMYVDPNNHSLGLQSCNNGYTYYFDVEDRQTVSSEWELVCDKKFLVRIYQTINFAGVTVGGLFFGYLSDNYGRYPTTFISCFGQAVFGVATTFVYNFEASCVLAFLRGFCLQGITVAGFTLMTEMFNDKFRSIVSVIIFSFPALGMALVVLYNYPIPNWRYQVLAHTCTTSVGLIGLIFFTRESIRWLLSQNNIDKARNVVLFTVKMNGLPPPQNLDNKLKETVSEIQSKMKSNKKQSMLDVMKHPFLRNTCLIQFVGVLSAQMSFYGFSFLISEIGGNVYVNFVVASVVEFAFRGVGYFMIEHWGRRKTSVLLFAIMSASNFIYTGTHYYQEEYPVLETVSMVVAIVGRIFNGLYFIAAMTLCTELSPTTVRSSIFGAVNTTGRLGLVCLPFLLLLGDYVWKQLPFVIFALFSLLSAFLFTLLPETKNMVIPNTIEESVNFKIYKFKSKNRKDIDEPKNLEVATSLINSPTV
ncbi:hypothetical protein CHUAL_005894 [Chamberlinius hualienensis]